jgi:hypothetical protein
MTTLKRTAKEIQDVNSNLTSLGYLKINAPKCLELQIITGNLWCRPLAMPTRWFSLNKRD